MSQVMSGNLRMTLAQLNLLVGDVEGNTRRIIDSARQARDQYHADLVIFTELSLTGYPPEDLLFRPSLLDRVEEGLVSLCREVQGIEIVLGLPLRHDGKLYNAAVHVRDGKQAARYFKQILPNYAVFDEKRYFMPGDQSCVVDIKGVRAGLTVCEDIWEPGPALSAKQAGAQLLININASPFHIDKQGQRLRVLRERVAQAGLPIVYVNQVGGQDELVFDGQSLLINAQGAVDYRAPAFEEGLFNIQYHADTQTFMSESETAAADLQTDIESSLYAALVLGVRDYVVKNGFSGAVIGLSGGIDSALTLVIAVDALGAENVQAVMMPSRYTADMSLEDARWEAEALSVAYSELSIEATFNALLAALEKTFEGLEAETTEENMQARIRGTLLMAISNKSGRMLLTTGNKSEMAVGYATLYGDMAGGYAPLKDVYKTMVYRLAEYRNRISTHGREVIPQRVITRPPSAELAEDQKDEDSLPPYAILDSILAMFVEQDYSVQQIIEAGFEAETVRSVAGMVLRNEYKRRQSPPGVKVTQRAFGKDRRYPITSGYRCK